MDNDTRLRDIDETRRLLYGAIVASRTRRWELVGTLANALTHHVKLVADPYDLMDDLIELVDPDGTFDASADGRVRTLIDQLTQMETAETGRQGVIRVSASGNAYENRDLEPQE